MVAGALVQLYNMSFFDEFLYFGTHFVLEVYWYSLTFLLNRNQWAFEYRTYPMIFQPALSGKIISEILYKIFSPQIWNVRQGWNLADENWSRLGSLDSQWTL